MRVCHTCLKIFSTKNVAISAERIYHHDNFVVFERSAKQCDICEDLWPSISRHERFTTAQDLQDKVTDVHPITKYFLRESESQNVLEIWFTFYWPDITITKYSSMIGPFYLEPIDKCCFGPSGHTMAADMSNTITQTQPWDLSLQRASKWLSQCLHSDEKCRAVQTSQFKEYRPTRLIQIGYPTSEKIRLLPGIQKTPVRYATVSHCWGQSKTIRLTTLSRRLLEDGIPISELGQTIQDCIRAVRSLGIEFVWIDSLCIIQDCRDDWQHEAPSMSFIYKNALINVAASSAADGDAGCFGERDSSSLKTPVIETSWAVYGSKSYRFYDPHAWGRHFSTMPLMDRAWVVQELLVAPRILHLCGTQLFWECYALHACEIYANGMPYPYDLIHSDRLLHAYSSNDGSPTPLVPISMPRSKHLRDLWEKIVLRYTQCSLTYPSDKLVALSAVARQMAAALNDQYCAGLWKSQFVTDLSWSATVSINPWDKLRHRPQVYRAPTWSWASLDGMIRTSRYYGDLASSQCEEMVEITSCNIDHATGDPFGVVTSGTIELSGWLVSMKFSKPSPNAGYRWPIFFNGVQWEEDERVTVKFDCRPDTLELYCVPLYVKWVEPPERSHSGVFPSQRSYEIEWSVYCLILQIVEGTVSRFTRTGWLSIGQGALGMSGNDAWKLFRNAENESYVGLTSDSVDNERLISII